MPEVVNLRRFRKHKLREEKAAKADRNRAAFGRTKAEKQRLELERRRDQSQHEGHRLSAPSEPDPGKET